MVLYTGTFEAYQGLDLLFAAAKVVQRERPDARFVLAGGKPDQVATREKPGGRDRRRWLIFTGELPSEAIPAYLDAADALVSPRSSGTNTPLKIYQYLRSGRVIVATRLLTHTQVLSDEVAILDGAEPPTVLRAAYCRRSPIPRPPPHRRCREASGRHALHLRGLPSAHARSLRRAGGLDGLRALQLFGVCRSGYGRELRREAIWRAIGTMLLHDQERVLAEFLGDISGRRVLDMATGTGRAALALAQRGAIEDLASAPVPAPSAPTRR